MAMQTEDHTAAAGPMPAAPGHETAAVGAHEGATPAGEHAEGGLPQFDFSWWPGQIAWFLIIFFVVLAFMRLFAVPKVGGTIDAREGKIAGDIADARRMKDEADAADDLVISFEDVLDVESRLFDEQYEARVNRAADAMAGLAERVDQLAPPAALSR
ncbi:MAG: hypothetical protein KKE02_21605, partial [Alphaproteobacteria bacterium]|nr:hypothetical protein [Alphaproteobacteria bacterium]